jgi:ComF family protein
MTPADMIIPVPLHVKRLRQRGFNQSVPLGNVLARDWRIPLCRHNLRRIRWTDPQTGLSAAERVSNVRGAFAVTNPALVKGKRVILLDDVYTTGSTVAECARTLLKFTILFNMRNMEEKKAGTNRMEGLSLVDIKDEKTY